MQASRFNPFTSGPAYSSREDHYVEPKWEKVRVRVTKPFFWRETHRARGVALPMGETRRVEIGEVIECILPDAQSLIGAARAELVK